MPGAYVCVKVERKIKLNLVQHDLVSRDTVPNVTGLS